MTEPRRIVPGEFYMVTRRTLLRTFLLRPNEAINRMFEYCLAESAARFGIDLIAWCAMSNHYHAIIYDPDGRVPAFIERLHMMMAKALNRIHRRSESVWSREQTCLTRLVTLDDVFDKVVYVLTNPAAADLVDDIVHWPGASSWTRMGADPKVVERPQGGYFCAEGLMPEQVELRAVAPRGLLGESYIEWIERVRTAVKLRQGALTKKRSEERRHVLGRKGVLATDPFSAPTTKAPRSRLRPHLACKDKTRMKQERALLNGFRTQYRSTRKRLRGEGEDEGTIEFPVGTYRLRLLGLPCEGCNDAPHVVIAKKTKPVAAA